MKSKILILMTSILLLSCDRDEERTLTQIPKGDYTGLFTVEYNNGDTFSNTVTVRFLDDNVYSSSGNTDYYPAGGSGTFEINNSTIKFNDVNFWTANFDWNLILNSEYDYSLNGNELIISANKNDVGFYQYALTRE